MDFVECTTQKQLDKIKPGDVGIVHKGRFTASGSAIVRATDSATVRATGSATVRATGSATVTAYDSATVRAYGSATVRATPYVAVHKLSPSATIKGGVTLTPPNTETCDAATWLNYYGIKVTKTGYAVLFKAVNDDFQTTRGPEWTYTPGATLTPAHWDSARSCGDGLHLCAAPHLSARYLNGATKFVAVRVKAADIVPLGDKCKVPSLKVLHEVTVDGERVSA